MGCAPTCNTVDVDVERERGRRVVVVSSSLPAEGKSTTAVTLAIMLWMAGERVALVEANLRRPLLSQRAGLDGAVGTTNVSIGRVTIDDALQTYGSARCRAAWQDLS